MVVRESRIGLSLHTVYALDVLVLSLQSNTGIVNVPVIVWEERFL
jgi:hypothetical protein